MNPFKLADQLIESSFRIPVMPCENLTHIDNWVPKTIDKAQQTIALGELLTAIRDEYTFCVNQLQYFRARVGFVHIVQTIHLDQNSWTEIHGYFATMDLATEFLATMKRENPTSGAAIFTKKVEYK